MSAWTPRRPRKIPPAGRRHARTRHRLPLPPPRPQRNPPHPPGNPPRNDADPPATRHSVRGIFKIPRMGKTPATIAAFDVGPAYLKFVEMPLDERRVIAAGIFPFAPGRWLDR